MFDPLQFGIPGAAELVVLVLLLGLGLVVPLAVGLWVADDARKRGSDHHLAWGATGFLSGFAYLVGLVVFVVFYLVVREDIGPAPAG